MNLRLKMSHLGCTLVRHFQARIIIFQCRTNDVLYMFCRMANYQLKIVYRLLRWWRNVSEYRLPSKNAHRPIILFMVTCVFIECYSNFYCKIALINRFKLYLIKILMIRGISCKQKQRIISYAYI